ncbi:oxidoreductase domain protein [Sediminispirochaeta smaragdinae DSM 11293]|uniref:Oxidoreductase domain protein n=1 Tax=Sediminispirochaeta smaragdinae (strain DSM 11293 / JCM 15392 / SEBR 4228) TaxID=573413 RepID=E1R626_SEDSS|nr:oxidoreductase domain protein [Sediminispirochaeta smaragdinae DSM 11293]
MSDGVIVDRLRCAAIGLGRLGWRHAANLAGTISGAELVAVSDVSVDACKRFSSVYPDVKVYMDYHDVLQRADIDAVIIASSTSMHAVMLRDAVASGKAIFCEKPLSLDLQEARELQRLVKEHGSFVQLGFMRRFDTGYAAAKERIESGAIGTPVSLLGISRDPSCPPIEFAKTSGGLVMDLCIHDIDLCRWFLGGEVTEVYARGAVVRYGALRSIGDIDHVNIDLSFSNGPLASVEGSRNSRYGYDVRTEVICTDGAAFIGKMQDEPVVMMDAKGVSMKTVPGFLERFEQAYRSEMERFVEDVLTHNPPAVGVDDGVAAMEIAEAAQTSLVSGRTVALGRR